MKILYYGDSITDCGRNWDRGSLSSIGQGYALITAAELMGHYPGEYDFDNTGISGNRIVDLYARIKGDCWNRNPDVISILIGVNDVWHEVGAKNGVEADRFEKMYRMIIEDTKKVNPDIKFMLLEPFILKGSATEGAWDIFKEEVAIRAEIVKRVAEDYSLTFVPLQNMFDEACKLQPASYWLGDGVHPTVAGHQLIADEWMKAFKTL